MRLATDKDNKRAEAVFKQMAKVKSDPTRGYRMLAKLYLNTDQNIDQALQLAKRSVDASPIADSYFVLGWACSKNNQNEAAKKALERAIQLDGSKAIYRQLYQTLK